MRVEVVVCEGVSGVWCVRVCVVCGVWCEVCGMRVWCVYSSTVELSALVGLRQLASSS